MSLDLVSYTKPIELDLTPKTAQPLVEGDGGSYYIWLSSEVQILAETNVAAGQFILQPRGFAFPHYADSSKVGYVVEAAQIAGDEGMESYSIVTTTKPLFEELAGKTSIWEALSPLVQQVSFNVDSKFQKLFISKVTENNNLIPPTI
ncbi:hypothetical protein KIW84_071597 [Lathyrus oleraceus]|uniref:Uncharacterized protein n=1 Tax=Pisum sativum TaxID=3888 RepID=A0A9D4VKM5_PEA|nr:hypothetical protein KIW84_071597 [Pisum sativum]